MPADQQAACHPLTVMALLDPTGQVVATAWKDTDNLNGLGRDVAVEVRQRSAYPAEFAGQRLS